MSRYVVWSTHLVDDQPVEVIEVTRSDPKVAHEDAALIRSILGRKAWVQDSEERK